MRQTKSNEFSAQIEIYENNASFYYFTDDREQISIVDLMNMIAFGGPINEKLHQFMVDHIEKISKNNKKFSPKKIKDIETTEEGLNISDLHDDRYIANKLAFKEFFENRLNKDFAMVEENLAK